jgi:micrococcal nuclease
MRQPAPSLMMHDSTARRESAFTRRRRQIRIALLACCCAVTLFISCGKKDPLRDLESARVVRIRDGDTIELADGRAVRYIGIDTPEEGQPGADSATVLNTTLVLGKTVRLEYGGERLDRYGRTLAFVWVDGRMVNREILKAGWASCYFFEKNLKHARELVQALDGAMDNHRGLWKLPHTETADHYVASDAGFRFHRPDCPSVGDIGKDAIIIYTVRDSAVYHGFSPCHNCLP